MYIWGKAYFSRKRKERFDNLYTNGALETCEWEPVLEPGRSSRELNGFASSYSGINLHNIMSNKVYATEHLPKYN